MIFQDVVWPGRIVDTSLPSDPIRIMPPACTSSGKTDLNVNCTVCFEMFVADTTHSYISDFEKPVGQTVHLKVHGLVGVAVLTFKR